MEKFKKLSLTSFLRQEKALFLAAATIVAGLILLSLLSWNVVSAVVHWGMDGTHARLREAIATESNKLLGQVRDIVESDALTKYIEQKDTLELITLLNEFQIKYGLRLLVVTDGNGIVLARIKFISARGDNFFETTSLGHSVAQGREAVTLTKYKLFPLVLMAGKPIVKEGVIVGAVFAGYESNDAFARRIKDAYLDSNTELAFYTKETGITGSTFAQEETGQLLDIYFNVGSELIASQNIPSEKLIQVSGKHYLAHIAISQSSKKEYGVLHFHEISFGSVAIIVAALLALFFFLIEIILQSRLPHPLKHPRHLPIIVFTSLFLFVGAFFVIYARLDRDAIQLKKSSFAIYNSTLHLRADADIIDRSFDKLVTIELRTGGEAINTVVAELLFDPALLEIKDILTISSICDENFIAEKFIDNQTGRARLICGIPNPGFSEKTGTVAEILLHPRKAGLAELTLGKNSKVLANDGLGTNVLRAMTSASYQITDTSSNAKNGATAFLIFSRTHPNGTRWYAERTVAFSWLPRKGYSYVYAFNQIPDFVPNAGLPTEKSGVEISVEKDGIYSFHLSPLMEGKDIRPSHFKVMIDGTPPRAPKISLSSAEIKQGETVRIQFDSSDEMSGLQSGYFVKIDGGLLLPVQSPLYLPLTAKGKHTITVRAFDNANNWSESTALISVK